MGSGQEHEELKSSTGREEEKKEGERRLLFGGRFS
jgi:hypothetical protein